MTVIDTTTSQSFQTISAAILASGPGDTIAIPAGLYSEEFPLITHSLTLKGVDGFAQLTTPNPAPANGRAILYVAGGANADLTVANLELTGAHVPGGNGAGILFETGNRNLSITRSWFHDNQEGLLTGGGTGSTVSITLSEFNDNGLPVTDPRYGFSHNVYIGDVDTAVITASYFHDALGGHEIKSRAHQTTITGNRIQDGPAADTSYGIDLPNGGAGLIANNVIQKGPGADNRYSIHFGGDLVVGAATSYPNSGLRVVGNLLINDRIAGGSGILNQSVNAAGDSFGAIASDNTLWNYAQFYADRTGAPIGPNDSFSGNLMFTGAAPPLDTSHRWDTPEPASAALLAVALLATAALRRRRARAAR